jgi:hypothetical protein
VQSLNGAPAGCRILEQAQEVMHAIASRLAECRLTVHPEKSKIVYCKDRSRTQTYPNVTFTFPGFLLRPRRAMTKYRRVSTSFLPGVGPAASKRMRQAVRGGGDRYVPIGTRRQRGVTLRKGRMKCDRGTHPFAADQFSYFLI